MSSWIESLRSRCGPFADAAERFADLEGVAIDPPRGVDALRALHHAIERHRVRAQNPADADAERAFIERAGAFLATVIADHVAAAQHGRLDGQHRLMLSNDAVFDPFVGIERLLDAPDVGSALVTEVLRAERAAGGRGLRPGDLDEPWSRARKIVLARLIGPRVLAEMGAAGDHVFAQPLAGDLRLVLVLRYPGRARFARHGERQRWPDDACAQAIRNLARASDRAKFVHVEGEEGSFVTARSADGLDAARLLLPGLHDVLAPELGSPFAAAVPHRDALFACRAADRASVSALAERARLEHDRARHGISGHLYLVHPGALITRHRATP